MTTSIVSKSNGVQGALQVNGVDSIVFDANGLILPSVNGGQIAGFRNRIINGNFGINQRGMISPVTGIAVGQYAHDRWCGGTAASAYSFSTAANVTTITITSGTLKQIVEGLNLETGTYTLSWSGTAQGKIGVGSYGASGITGSITGGTNTTIEFGPGTVSKVQLEFGSTASVFEQRSYGLELTLCQRYYEKIGGVAAGDVILGAGSWTAGVDSFHCVPFNVTKRVQPTVTKVGTWSVTNCLQPTVYGVNLTCFYAGIFSTGASGQTYAVSTGTSTYFTASAEL